MLFRRRKKTETEAIDTETRSVQPDARAAAQPETQNVQPVIQEAVQSEAQTEQPETQNVQPDAQAVQSEAQTEQPGEETDRPKKAGKRRGLVILLVLLLIVAGAYGYGVYYTHGHFMRSTTLNGYDVSGMTPSEAEKYFVDKAGSYALHLRFRGDQEETVSGSSIDYRFRQDGAVAKEAAGQPGYLWFLQFFRSQTLTMKESVDYDQDKLSAALNALPQMQADNQVKPENACLTIEDGSYTIKPEVEGNTIVSATLLGAVRYALDTQTENLDAESVSGVYESPTIRSDNEDLVAEEQRLQELTKGKVTYDLPGDEKIRLDAETTHNWLVKDSDGKLQKDEDTWNEKLTDYVNDLAEKVGTVGKSRKFKDHNGDEITVSGGTYGYRLDTDAEKEQLAKDLASGDPVEREPKYSTREADDGQDANDGIGKTYIEADLGAQHVYIYKNGDCVLDTPCVSGNTSEGHGTPTGVFRIQFMQSPAVLRGKKKADGTYSYESPVTYWMPFYDGCGFHDADWRSSFGGTIYRSNGSHGCVNLPVSVAGRFYRNVEDGMVVVVHY